MALVALLVAVLGQHGVSTVQARINENDIPRDRPNGGGNGWDLPDWVEDAADLVEDAVDCVGEVVDGVRDVVDCAYAIANKERLNCSVRAPKYAEPDWLGQCTLASSLMNNDRKCIPASAFKKWGCLNLDTDAVLCDDGQRFNMDDGQPFNMTVYLSTDNSTLDCNEQTIDHGGGKKPGILTPNTYSVSDIRISNCTISNTGYGINLKRFFRGAELEGPMEGHRHITIEHTFIANTQKIGIYVGQNSQHVVIRNVKIDNATKMGMYLEGGSTHTHISGVTITNTRQEEQAWWKLGLGEPRGEAIAIDSSQYNVIEHSTFSGNEGGGITLYKNCGENYGQVCPVRRPLSASHNEIQFNEFHGDGVNVAWRQFKLYGFEWCAGIDVAGYWRDHASYNLIHGNHFYDTKLDVQDGPNTVSSNEFIGTELELGKDQPGGWVDQPVEIDGSITENVFDEGCTIDLGTTGVFDDLEVFNNRTSNGACLALRDVCVGEVFNYTACLALQNACGWPTVPLGVDVMTGTLSKSGRGTTSLSSQSSPLAPSHGGTSLPLQSATGVAQRGKSGSPTNVLKPLP
jgi:hypothetical protein